MLLDGRQAGTGLADHSQLFIRPRYCAAPKAWGVCCPCACLAIGSAIGQLNGALRLVAQLRHNNWRLVVACMCVG